MSINIYFNPLDTACKNIIGAVCEGETLQLNVYCLKHKGNLSPKSCQEPIPNAFLKLNKDGEESEDFLMDKTPFGWSISLKIHEIGLYYYCFYIENSGYISCGKMEQGILSGNETRFLLTVYAKDYETPEWFKGGVMYQIFPDRFCREGSMPDIKGRVNREDWGGMPSYKPNEKGKVLNNDFFGGNFKGIQSKLPYLKALGVTVIYCNPVFEAASNHRYDTSDYMRIDPMLGTEEDFASFVKAAKDQGIRVILDGVFNHTGDNSLYFNKYGEYSSLGAYQSKDSPYYNWYSFQKFPDKYSSWWGIDILPEINESSEEYQNFIFGKDGVLKKWLKFGIGGYRLDVADELPDFFLKKLRKSVKESDESAIIIGEVWEDASNKIAYSKRREYLHGYELDSVMNYPLKDAIIQYVQSGNAETLLQTVYALINHYPKSTMDCLMNILGTHDTARILTVLGGIQCRSKDEMACDWALLNKTAKESAIQKLKIAAVLQYTMPGVPCLYYGDENGMEGHIDPFCRKCFDWDNLNADLINFYQKLGEIRKMYRDIFKDGEFQALEHKNGFLIYKRAKNESEIYVYTNLSSKKQILKLEEKYLDCITNQIFENEIVVKANSYGIIAKV